MNAQITFLDGTLSLIHIPLPLYSTFLQPILQILLPPSQPLPSSSSSPSTRTIHHQDETTFLNISISPLECSIVCPSSWACTVFEPAIARLPKDQAKTISVSKDAYAVFSVISAGMDAGSRVVDLTCPLALAGIPIFFITTYYSDFILVPTKDRKAVVETLRAKGGFVFVDEDGQGHEEGYGYGSRRGSVTMTSGTMGYHHHTRGGSSGSGGGGLSGMLTPMTMPTTPPPSDAGELQLKTFETLKRRNVVPFVEPGLRLVHCSGREKTSIHGGGGGEGGRGHGHSNSMAGENGDTNGGGYPRRRRNSWIDTVDTKLYTSIISALVSQPRFLSVTLAQDDPPSLLLDKALVDLFGDSLVGPTEGTLVPIFLDLVNLPFEATGIVSGVAGRLVKDMPMAESAELSYLSTARAGAVILSCEQAVTALGILEPLLKKQG
ncbi:ACT domain-containing protein [Pseudoneurospora amorphoporcata]|uniref:ACT domain-containing protein n=1 Tax=Pseudoneurospora amorphoporcata TaxID=241081 RepID=A0AAN6NPL0_9PEZI|nr:ACT domain-containing protein [Pseudoneurospora amorphoporcata]